MSRRLIADKHAIAAVLRKLDNLDADEYITAFGARGENFYGTPNGYSASHLPVEILNAVASGLVKKILWVSFGSNPDSWFFAYEMRDGRKTWRYGSMIPATLAKLLEIRRITPEVHPQVRVQLNSDDSFILWFWPMWVCYDVPLFLKAELEFMSTNYQRQGAIETGYFSEEAPDIPDNITWHRDGSFYIHTPWDHAWKFGPTMDAHWKKLWEQCPGDEVDKQGAALLEMAHVGINPHTLVSDNFAFILKQKNGVAAPFDIHFGKNDKHSRLPETNPADNRPEHLANETDTMTPKQWARSKCSGRPNPKDSWELKLEKGERVEVTRDCGQDWFIVKNHKGTRGWAHLTWLEFGCTKSYTDPERAYKHFEKDMRRYLVPGKLRNFPPVSSYLDMCTEVGCVGVKTDTKLGMCIHDLDTLLQASGKYSYEWLKEERNVWHPDKFARYCHEDAEDKEELKLTAQELFVMYGTLMDKCKAGAAGAGADPRGPWRG